MSLTGLLFLFVFLPTALILYYVLPDALKEYLLFALSILFYAIGSPGFAILFLLVILANVLLGRVMQKLTRQPARRILLIMGIVLDAGILIYYKYTDFAISTVNSILGSDFGLMRLALPLGISFFTFKAISYLADIYTRKAQLAGNPVHDLVYLSFFGQILSGPLTRYNDMTCQQSGAGDRFDLFSEGVTRFLIGFNKKVLLANVLANITNEVFATPVSDYSTLYAWLGSITYSLQLFFDFAGYSDMAIGLSNMFGYNCMENFRYPYMTESVAGFWRRWHISLSEWFRDYIYIPLGGSRAKKKWRVFFNLLVVWVFTGIWHGAMWTFVAWGLGYFVFISFERLTGLPKRLSGPGKGLYRIVALIFINCQWILFRSDHILSGLRFIKRLFVYHANSMTDLRILFLFREYAVFLAGAFILCFPLFPWLEKKLLVHEKGHVVYQTLLSIFLLASFIWAVSFVVAGQNNPFAYANF